MLKKRAFNTFAATALVACAPGLVPFALADNDKQEKKEEGFSDLFNKKDLKGWFTPYDWGEIKIIDEEIHLKANKKFFLLTDREFADFIFEGEIMMPDAQSNSGFMFRCAAEENHVWGYQAEVDPSERRWSGGLYDESRRGWLHPKKGDKASEQAFVAQGDPFKPGEWNKYRIHAEGDRLRIWVNGTLTADVRDSMDSQGYLGIQHHGEKGKVYRFRNLRVKELRKALGQDVSLFDGKTLNGFSDAEGKPVEKGWIVKDNAIYLEKPEEAGDLFVDGNWRNFQLTFEWKLAEGGKSGLGYRFAPEGKEGDLNGPVFAMLDHDKNKKQAADKRRRSGAIFGVFEVGKDANPKKIGEWNAGKILAYNYGLFQELNGKWAAQTNLDSASWKRMIKNSNFHDHETFGRQEGRIVLRNLGHPVWIKNLKIRVLR